MSTAIVLLLSIFAVSVSTSRFRYTDHLMSSIGQEQARYLDLKHDLLLDCHCPRGYVCRVEHGVRRCVIDYMMGGVARLSDARGGPTFLSDLMGGVNFQGEAMGGATGSGRQLVGFIRTRPSDQTVGSARFSDGSVGGATDFNRRVNAQDSGSVRRGVRGDNYWGMLTSLRNRSGMSVCARYDVPSGCQRKFYSAVPKFTFNHMTGSCKEVKVCNSCYNVNGVRYNLFDTLYDCTVSCGRLQ